MLTIKLLAESPVKLFGNTRRVSVASVASVAGVIELPELSDGELRGCQN